ncbi:MAG: very short patch repair endonuclease [Methylorubrum populi]
MTDLMTPMQRSRCMSRIRSANTKPEIALRRLLFASGLRFRTKLKLPGRPDIVFTRAKMAVFIDGCFWHGCPAHGTRPKSNAAYWNAKLDRNRERDLAVTASLVAEGWQVLRYWEHQVYEDPAAIATEVKALWRSAIEMLESRRLAADHDFSDTGARPLKPEKQNEVACAASEPRNGGLVINAGD